MKRIIAFVLLGLLIYAGGYVIYYASVDFRINTTVAKDLFSMDYSNMHTWNVVEGKVYQVINKFKTETTQPTLFGFPYGKPIEQHYYIMPINDTRMFLLLTANDEHDIEILEQLKTNTPHKFAEGDLALEIRGVAEKMPLIMFTNLKMYIINNDLVESRKGLLPVTEAEAAGHIIPYIIHVRHTSGNEHIPLIIGITMCLVGIGLAVLLFLKIKSEREGY